MSEANGSNGNGNGHLKAVLVPIATLLLGGTSVGGAIALREEKPEIASIRAEVAALRTETVAVRERVVVLEVVVNQFDKKLDLAIEKGRSK